MSKISQSSPIVVADGSQQAEVETISYPQSSVVLQTGVAQMLQTQRAMPNVPPPVMDYLDSTVLFSEGFMRRDTGKRAPKASRRTQSGSEFNLPINLQALQTHFLAEGTLSPDDAIKIVEACQAILQQEPNVLSLEEPLTVVGDIHGQYYDLVKLLEIGGDPQEQPYLFLGDYVDRGCFSCECLLTLYALKVCYPTSIYLLRGNHEGRHLTSYFSFKAECYFKYTPEFYDACMLSFDRLPLAATVGDRYFCVHGGLSPEVMHIEEISYLHRFRDIPSSGAMCDLLWSDPHWDVENPSAPSASGYDFSTSSFFETEAIFTPNQARGCSFIFNFACLYQFISTNDLLCLIRAHEAQEDGYKLYRPHPNTHFPAMLSLFSAPNYCDSYDNKGAILQLRSGQMCLKQFHSSPHPYVLPNFINAIEWSLPFVIDKLQELLSVLDGLDDEVDSDSEVDWTPRKKILVIGRLRLLC